ncbi:hypothetical protein F383_28751 [Gossypium arboreum]|uniref:Uncharacterized protein n=1 Tax=Gossypium arboreum TaxID=29729 RepID=A0A0B0MPE6_GOSAR|nr:hypothetical protein F383_28751 [Gossypium arboreum]
MRLRYYEFINSEVSSGQKVGRLRLFEITHMKKDGSSMTSEAGEIIEKLKEKKAEYERLLRLIGLVLPRPNILDPAPSNTCLSGVKLKLKFRAEAADKEATAVAREAAAAAREAEASKKYDELQLQLQQMMQMFQQSQKPPS